MVLSVLVGVGEGLGFPWAGEEKPLPQHEEGDEADGETSRHTREQLVLALGPISQITLSWVQELPSSEAQLP